MDRLEELKILKEAQSQKVTEAYNKLEEKRTVANTLVISELENIVKPICQRVSIKFEFDDYCNYGSVGILDEKDESNISTEIEIRMGKPYGSTEYELTFSIGSCGRLGKKDTVQINKYRVLNVLIEHFDDLESLIKKNYEALKPFYKEYNKEDSILTNFVGEEEDIIKDREKQTVIDSIQVGNLYKIKGYTRKFKSYDFAKLVEIKNKTAVFEVGCQKYGKTSVLNSDGSPHWDYLTDENGKPLFDRVDDYRMGKDEFVGMIMNGQLVLQ